MINCIDCDRKLEDVEDVVDTFMHRKTSRYAGDIYSVKIVKYTFGLT